MTKKNTIYTFFYCLSRQDPFKNDERFINVKMYIYKTEQIEHDALIVVVVSIF